MIKNKLNTIILLFRPLYQLRKRREKGRFFKNNDLSLALTRTRNLKIKMED